MLDDNATELARLLNVHRTSIYAIRDGVQLPQLTLLLRMSKLFGTSPIDLLTKDVYQIEFPDPHTICLLQSPPVRNRAPRKFDREAIRHKLQNIIASDDVPPLSMVQVALSLDYDSSFLEKQLPDECKRITQRYTAYQIKEKALREERDREKARQATLDIHSSGSYPSSPQEVGVGSRRARILAL